ncbi:hypothetical protein DPMN_124839 [Dreissena polymorpha]|uniref:CIDE-N domain-containing protein n=1 Tax=Dreissena polymorpha TaxID=45954 RepID=A0A9D4GTB9_DREPO|nr:hypothetical protein DPMN_124839 [Dreissena polymorpha]
MIASRFPSYVLCCLFILIGTEKFGYTCSTECMIVIEKDGTEVDGEYLDHVNLNEVLMLLKAGEKWGPCISTSGRESSSGNLCYLDPFSVQ